MNYPTPHIKAVPDDFGKTVLMPGDPLRAKFIAEKLSVIDGIVSVQTHFILKKYKIEGQVTKPAEECKRQLIHV